VHLPALGLWLDAHEPISGPERVFVSHAHSDHIAEHHEPILTAPTARLMQARLPQSQSGHVLEFHQSTAFQFGDVEFRITLLPAGHIFGSAMAVIDAAGQSLLYTGDFKLRSGLSAERCEPAKADILIMETTFGRPEYVFPPVETVLKNIVRFCREALDNDETPVLLGYSLGKSQELLCSLGDSGLPLMLHGAVFHLTRIYEQFGHCFPPCKPYQAGAARGKVLLCPPNVVNSAMLRNIGPSRTAILTGWALDPNCKYRYQCDAAFPLSDHADFPELIELVKRVSPRTVYTLHGFAADFAKTLRDLGFDARALSQNEQFTLDLGPQAVRARGTHSSTPLNSSNSSNSFNPFNCFSSFAATCRAISLDTRKLEKIRLLAEYLRQVQGDALAWAATWFSGSPFPSSHNKVLRLGWAVIRDAISSTTGQQPERFHQAYSNHSDLGEAAAELLENQKQRQEQELQPSLTIEDVGALFTALHATRGPLGKTPILTRALACCTPLEAKYLVKIMTGDLRIGLKEGLVEDAIALAFGRQADEVRNANLLLGDIGQTAWLAREARLRTAALTPFRPVKFMLASPEPTAQAIWERICPGADSPRCAARLEDKYDGIRCQLHKAGARVALYSRDLKDITAMFIELADACRSFQSEFVLDGEIVAMRDDRILPFAELQKRLGRREPDLFMREEIPIKLVTFDLLWLDGQSLLDRPLRERRALLEGLQPLPPALQLARLTSAASPAEIEAAFQAARQRGNEGLVIKDPQSPYTPGRRGLSWLKLKKPFATLDCVVIGAEFGHGKRNKVLSDYTFAVRDESTRELKTIGKAYSGLTDAEIAALTQHFLETATRRHGRYFEVPPDTVLEIAFDRLQPSDRHTSGLAMRFPRILRIRTDKSPDQIDTVQTARSLLAKLERANNS
jgi:DNA ligase-1